MQRTNSNVSNKSNKIVTTRRSGLMRTNSKALDDGNGPNLEKFNPPNGLTRDFSVGDMFATNQPAPNALLRSASNLLRGNSGIGSPPKRNRQSDTTDNRFAMFGQNQPRNSSQASRPTSTAQMQAALAQMRQNADDIGNLDMSDDEQVAQPARPQPKRQNRINDNLIEQPKLYKSSSNLSNAEQKLRGKTYGAKNRMQSIHSNADSMMNIKTANQRQDSKASSRNQRQANDQVEDLDDLDGEPGPVTRNTSRLLEQAFAKQRNEPLLMGDDDVSPKPRAGQAQKYTGNLRTPFRPAPQQVQANANFSGLFKNTSPTQVAGQQQSLQKGAYYTRNQNTAQQISNKAVVKQPNVRPKQAPAPITPTVRVIKPPQPDRAVNTRARPPTTLEVPTRKRDVKAAKKSNDDSSEHSTHSHGKKKRGRKREAWDRYVQAAQEKIAEFKAKLATAKRDGIPVKERQKWRNVVSAQQSRLKKKYEVKFLNQIIESKDDGIEDFLTIVADTLLAAKQPELLAKIIKDAQNNIHPVDNQAQDEFETILPDEDNKSARIGVRPFTGPRVDKRTFVDGTKQLLQTSEEILQRFQHNDEKDEADYAAEEAKASKKK